MVLKSLLAICAVLATVSASGLHDSYGVPLAHSKFALPFSFSRPLTNYGVPSTSQVLFNRPESVYGLPQPTANKFYTVPTEIYSAPPANPSIVYGLPPVKTYEAPTKPLEVYGPPAQVYGPPAQIYGPPKFLNNENFLRFSEIKNSEQFSVLNQRAFSLPKLSTVYGVPQKPLEVYGPPAQVYGPPKPPATIYGTPIVPAKVYGVPN